MLPREQDGAVGDECAVWLTQDDLAIIGLFELLVVNWEETTLRRRELHKDVAHLFFLRAA
jgi:hypothetical protein